MAVLLHRQNPDLSASGDSDIPFLAPIGQLRPRWLHNAFVFCDAVLAANLAAARSYVTLRIERQVKSCVTP